MKLLTLVITLFISFLLSRSSAHAQDVSLYDSNSPFFAIQGLLPSDFLTVGVSLVFVIAGILSFLYLLWGGVQWISAGGDKEAIDKSRRRIIQSIIGLVIILSVYVIVNLVEYIFNINLLSGVLPSIN